MITIPGVKGHIYTYVWYRVDTTNITCLVCKIMWKVATGLVARHTRGRQKNSRCCTLHALRYGYSTHPWWYKYVYAYNVPSDPISTLPTLELKDRSFWSFLCDETGWSGTTTFYAILRTYVVVDGCGYRKKEKEEKTNKPEFLWLELGVVLCTFAHIHS